MSFLLHVLSLNNIFFCFFYTLPLIAYHFVSAQLHTHSIYFISLVYAQFWFKWNFLDNYINICLLPYRIISTIIILNEAKFSTNFCKHFGQHVREIERERDEKSVCILQSMYVNPIKLENRLCFLQIRKMCGTNSSN